jgi:hypothetical protein
MLSCLPPVRENSMRLMRFANLENLSFSKDMNRSWENTKENIKISGKEIIHISLKSVKDNR